MDIYLLQTLTNFKSNYYKWFKENVELQDWSMMPTEKEVNNLFLMEHRQYKNQHGM